VAIIIGPYVFNVRHFQAHPEGGYHADFYVYVSPKAKRLASKGKPVVILVQPNNSGNSDDPEFHEKDAWWMCFGRHRLANELGVALLVPAFIRPAQDWHIYTHALDLDVFTTERIDLKRIDLQLISMIEHTRATLEQAGIATRKKILLQGYSASGMFANRFATLHPDRVMAVASGSPGGWPIAPVASYQNEALPYPAGITNLIELTGSPFDSIEYQKMPQLIVMGALDENDSLDYTDGWEEENADRVKRLFGATPISRWDVAKAVYRQGHANVQFELVEGIGHDRRSLQQYTTEFFRDVLAAD
jgi:dienelactone hydrolase